MSHADESDVLSWRRRRVSRLCQAPEIVNQEQYSQKADVFSFGIILWEILTRREPYKGYSGMALAYAVAKDNVRPEVPAYCPLEYATLMQLSWDQDPEKRPNFTDLVHSLLVRACTSARGGVEAVGVCRGGAVSCTAPHLTPIACLCVARCCKTC